MPLYEYECDACGRRFEVIQKFSDPAVEVCKHCGKGPVQKLMSSPAIQFKGSGFYITDYAQKGKSDSSAAGSSSTSGDSAKSDSGSTTTSEGGGSTGESAKSEGRKGESRKGEGAKSDGAKSDTAASSPKPSTGGTSKESKE
jgi:putative FmdB family regulatory protein